MDGGAPGPVGMRDAVIEVADAMGVFALAS